jgi:hypothetical protein
MCEVDDLFGHLASLRLAKTRKSNPATEKFKSGQLEIVSQREVEAQA